MTGSPKPKLDGTAPDSGSAFAAAPVKAPWQRPRLTVHGDLRELTMGPSPDTGESGQPLVLRA